MAQTLFDASAPDAVRGAWTVAALLLATGDALAARFGAVAVRGEISGWSRAGSGHCYFALKDHDGQPALLRCAMFRRAAMLAGFQPADGQQVEVRGRLAVYEARGELQMVVESLRRVGAGALYEEFLRLRERLAAAGLFDLARKRPLPTMPSAVGIVTSPAAAALHDVLTCLARRAPQLRIVIYPSPVQGGDAPAALAAALRLANARAEVDTVLLVRGGGSLEDLWAFNDERVVRALAASAIPVVCGIGHETDLTLADLAADLRAPTPTAAAELAAPSRAELLAAADGRRAALARALSRALERQAQRLDGVSLRIGRPAALLQGQQQRLLALQHRLRRALPVRLAQAAAVPALLADRMQRSMAAQLLRAGREPSLLQARLLRAGSAQRQRAAAHLALDRQRLAALDPARVLQRGYAWVEGADGRPIVSARALLPGQQVQAVWADGRARAEVLSVQKPLPEA